MKIVQNQKFFKRNLSNLIGDLSKPKEIVTQTTSPQSDLNINFASDLARSDGEILTDPSDKSAVIFKNVEFDNCDIGLQNDVIKPQIVKNVKFIDCKFTFCFFGPCIFEDVLFENISFEDYGRFNAAMFRRVKIKGKMTSFRINAGGFLTDKKPELSREIDAFRDKFYSQTNWALDISEAKLSAFDYSGIPARLFRLDPAVQFVVNKNKFYSLDQLSDEFKAKFSYIMMYLEDFLQEDREDIVLSVPMLRPKKYRQPIMDGLNEL